MFRRLPLYIIKMTITHRCVKLILLLHLSPISSIYNGEECSTSNHNFVVQIIGHKNRGPIVKCTGTLVKLDTVLTAAHCVTRFRRSIFSEPKVVLYTETGSITKDTKRILTHEKFDNTDLQYDVALLILEDYFPASLASTIKLPKHEKLQNFEGCQSGKFLGFGTTKNRHYKESSKPSQKYLRCINQPVVSMEACSLLRRLDKVKTFFCTFSGLDKAGGGCSGDSGGPFVCNGVQYGIASANFGCGVPGEPTFFTRIDKTLDFIEKCMRNSHGVIGRNVIVLFIFILLIRLEMSY